MRRHGGNEREPKRAFEKRNAVRDGRDGGFPLLLMNESGGGGKENLSNNSERARERESESEKESLCVCEARVKFQTFPS